jgi:type I restriction enzyme, S subunit
MASVKDMTHLSLDLQECRLISAEDFAYLSQQDCKPLVGDVLVSKDGAKYLDKVFEVLVENDVVVLSSIALLRPGDAIRSSILASMLKNVDTKARLKRSVSGAAIPRVVLKDFSAFKIVLPPMDLQDRFDRTGGSLIRVAARLEELNRALASTRDLLLPRLVIGRLNIADVDLGDLSPAEPLSPHTTSPSAGSSRSRHSRCSDGSDTRQPTATPNFSAPITPSRTASVATTSPRSCFTIGCDRSWRR